MAQPSERMADGRLRQSDQFTGAADMLLAHQRIEHGQQIEVELMKIDTVHEASC